MFAWLPRIPRILHLHLMVLICLCGSVEVGQGAEPGARLALLPVADVSGDNVSWDRELHHDLNEALVGAGYAMAEPEAVLNVVRRLRLRNLGEAGSFACRQMGEILNCDYILSVSVTESTGGNDPVLGLLLQLYRARDGMPVWGRSICYAAAQQIGFLGLNSGTELKQMRVQGITQLVEQLKDMPITNVPQVHNVPRYSVQVVDMPKRLLRCGSTLRFRLKVRTGQDFSMLRLSIGDNSVSLEPTDQIDIYCAEINAPEEPGVYEVYLTGSQDYAAAEHAHIVAHIETVRSAPHLALESSATPRAQGQWPVFNRRLVVRPRMEKRRPIARWSFKVTDSNNNKVLEQNSTGELPAAMYWRGTDARRFPLPSGRYTVTVHVEDEAGFSSSAAAQVYLQQPREELASVTQVVEEGESALLLKSTAPDEQGSEDAIWRVYITDRNGDTLNEITGQQLPARVKLPRHLTSNSEMFCQVYVKDGMGNHFWSETARIQEFIAADEKTESKERKFVWNSEF